MQCHTPADKLSSLDSSVREVDLRPPLMSYQLAPFLPHSLPFILLKEHFEIASACQLDPDPIQCWATSVKPLPVKVSPIEVLRPNQIQNLRLIQIVLLNRVDHRLLSALSVSCSRKTSWVNYGTFNRCLDQICYFENINHFY